MEDEIYVQPLEAKWTKGAEVVVSTMYQVSNSGAYRGRLGDEVVNYFFAPTKEVEVEVEEPEPHTETVTVPIEKSTISTEINASGNIEATVTVSTELSELYPNSLVEIDGEWYTLGKLDSAVVLFPGKDHRINIHWTATETAANGRLDVVGELVERFLIEWKY